MTEVQDMPATDDEEENEEDDDEVEDVEADGDQAQTESREVADEAFDEEAFQKQMSDRLEAMRLNKALGNDDPEDLEEDEVDSESESEEDTDSDSGDSVGPAPTEFSSFDQARRRKPPPQPRSKLGRVDELKLTVAQQVGKEREMKEKKFHSKKSVNKAGNAKGHKWKKSDAYAVGKNSGW